MDCIKVIWSGVDNGGQCQNSFLEAYVGSIKLVVMCTFFICRGVGGGGGHYTVIQTENQIKRTYFAKESKKNYH